MGKYQQQMAKLFKEKLDVGFQPTIAKVIKTSPNLTLSIFNDTVTLFPEMLYMNDRLFDDYTRDYELIGEIDYITTKTSSSNIIESNHMHKHGTITGNGEFSSTGVITNTDTLIVGDEVLVIPVEKGQLWVISFKVRKVK